MTAAKPSTDRATIELRLADGSSTGPVDLATMRAALNVVRPGPPLKADREMDRAADHAFTATADELRQFVERMEQLAAEKADIAEQQKELRAEAKGRGYDPRILAKIVALRKRKPDDVAEEEAVLDLYKSALGMA